MRLSETVLRQRKLQSLVENQTTYGLRNAEMHVFETHQRAERVLLKFDQPVLASMLEGKKVMHFETRASFDFLPGESLVLPRSKMMCIDFPEAEMDNPTRCLALTINEEKIRRVIDFLNEEHAKIDGENWSFAGQNFHFTNDTAIRQLIQRLLFVFTENHASKDVFADFMLRELIIRIVQNETREIYSQNALHLSSSHRLAHVIQYIRKNLDRELSVGELSKKAYMSESNFHRVFKNEFNLSPVEFINGERLKLAASLLQNPSRKIKDVCMQCGFNSLSYFIRLFKRKEKVSPKQYQLLASERREGVL